MKELILIKKIKYAENSQLFFQVIFCIGLIVVVGTLVAMPWTNFWTALRIIFSTFVITFFAIVMNYVFEDIANKYKKQ